VRELRRGHAQGFPDRLDPAARRLCETIGVSQWIQAFIELSPGRGPFLGAHFDNLYAIICYGNDNIFIIRLQLYNNVYIIEFWRKTLSKYAKLTAFLEALGTSSRRMGFAEIEKLLGFNLPRSARRYQAWWANNPVDGRLAGNFISSANRRLLKYWLIHR